MKPLINKVIAVLRSKLSRNRGHFDCCLNLSIALIIHRVCDR